MRNHGSIGLFWETVFGGKLGSGYFGLFLFYFCLARGERVTGAKDFGNQEGDRFMCHKPWFPFFSFLLVTILYVIQILSGPKTFLYIFFCFISIFDREFLFFFFFLPIFGRELSFYFALEARLQLNSEWIFFLGRSFYSFFQG